MLSTPALFRFAGYAFALRLARPASGLWRSCNCWGVSAVGLWWLSPVSRTIQFLLFPAIPLGAIRPFCIGHRLQLVRGIYEEYVKWYISSHPSLHNTEVLLILLIYFVYKEMGEIFTKTTVHASSTAIVDTGKKKRRLMAPRGTERAAVRVVPL